MKKYFVLLFISFSVYSQNIKITYLKVSNGSLIENQEPILVFANSKEAMITNQKILDGKAEIPFETNYFNTKKMNCFYSVAQINNEENIFTIDSISLEKQNFQILSESKKILGYTCVKAKTIINSNTIEVWYTNELNLYASPSILGNNLGVVLEINRNGNFIISATKIEKTKFFPKIDLHQKSIDLLTYKDLLWKSRFTTLPVFKDEIINFSDQSKSNDSVMRFANGTIALRKIKFPEIKKGSQVFVDLQEQSNGDAYDRTGSVFIIPTDREKSFFNGLQNTVDELPVYQNGNGKTYQGVVATTNYLPLLELMRFFTPFGIKHYNYIELKDKKWHDIVPYRQDVSELRAQLSNKEVWIGTFIGNYDKAGHKITMNITIHPEENATLNNETFVMPLFNTVNVMEMARQEYSTMFDVENGLIVNFTLDKDIKNARLRYISTGHGGWENGDEFVPKLNTILFNDKELTSFIPWRQDCGSYRLFNPASGNFPNGLSSSDYSRSNWCPGMVTNPIYINLGDVKAGNHKIQIKIPQGKPEGTSFSAWNVSGVLLGE